MIRKDVIFSVLTTFCLCALLFSAIPTLSNPSVGGYDPWLDINDDGKINMMDIASTARAFGATGDITKNVTVTNWPTLTMINWPNATDTAVWWQHSVGPTPDDDIVTSDYDVRGFTYLHVLVAVTDALGNDNVTLTIVAPLWRADHMSQTPIAAYTTELTAALKKTAFTIPVPSQKFYYWAYSSGAFHNISLSHYLTWG